MKDRLPISVPFNQMHGRLDKKFVQMLNDYAAKNKGTTNWGLLFRILYYIICDCRSGFFSYPVATFHVVQTLWVHVARSFTIIGSILCQTLSGVEKKPVDEY